MPSSMISGGQAISGGAGGVRPYAGTPVQVQLQFKDGSPACVMQGAVQFARDSYHRRVWLEATEGCPTWLSGRWWAELRTAESGWIVSNISSTPVDQQ